MAPPPPQAPETFTVSVNDYTFKTIKAIFGRLLKTKDGHIVRPTGSRKKQSAMMRYRITKTNEINFPSLNNQ